MKDLITRKIVLVMLVAVVLALGVQGNADAINRLTRTSGDLQTVTQGRDFQIQFTVGLQSTTTIPPGATGTYRRDSSITDKATNGYYYLDANNNNVKDTDENTTRTYDENHRYEQEQIVIAAPGVEIKKVGNNDVPGSPATLTMYESTHNSYPATSNPHQRLSSSVTLTITAPASAPTDGYVDITITPQTDSTPPPGHTEITGFSFRVYVVGPLNPAGTTSVQNTDGVELVSDHSDPMINGHFNFTTGSQPVYYSVEGSGRLYVSVASDRRTSSTNNLYTGSLAPVYLDVNGGSSKVTAYISGSRDAATVLYVFSGGRLSELPKIEVQSGSPQTGAPSGQLDDYFEVKVTDGKRRPISGLPVSFTTTAGDSTTPSAMFIPVPGTRVYVADADNDDTIDPPNAQSIDAVAPEITVATATTPEDATTHHVQTDRNGVAKIYYQLSSSPGAHTVTATAYGIGTSATLSATASTEARAGIATLEILSGNNQRADKGKFLEDDLVVIVRSLAGHRVKDAIIQFRTTAGILVRASGTNMATNAEIGLADDSLANPQRGQQIYVKTGPNGEAGVTYNVGQTTVARDIVAEVRNEVGSTQYDFAIDRVVFNVNGGGSGVRDTADDTAPDPTPTPDNLSISLSGSGDTRTVTVNALQTGTTPISNIFVNLSVTGGSLSTSSGVTPLESTWTLPSAAGTYTISVPASAGYTSDSESVTVTVPGTLTARQDGGTIVVTASPAPTSNLAFQLTTSGRVYAGGGEILPAGTGRAIPIGLTTGSHILTVNAEGYDPTQVSFTPGTQAATDTTTTTTTTTTTQTGTAGEADSIDIDGSRSIRGTVNQVSRLRVRVTDANNRGVSNVRVTYRVLAPGRGRLSQRGNGRAVVVQTDRNGDASASLTPLGGNLIVEAGAAGVSARVTFIIDVDGESTTPTTPRDTDTTPTPRRTIDPDVHVGAANRPPMLWIDGGSIYALVGADVQEFASGVEGAMNIAVGGGKVYWTEQTGESSGTINSANLNGSNAKELKSIKAVPMGIAVDTAGDKLYWTNSRGRIQSANLNGSKIENVMLDLPGPGDIAVARGILYWTQYDATEEEGNVGITNTAGRGTPKYISTGSDMPGSIAIGGNKVYWTEMTGSNSGTINSANLNGSGAEELNDIRAVPMGIGVDSSRSKLYWTNSRGRIQSADLDGSKIQNVVDGLGMPGDMVLSNSIEAPAKAPTTDAEQTAATSKYDINGDGAVDSKDVDALIVAVAAGVTDAKYDVNGDGKVDIFDVSAVSSKRDAGAAAAPALLGTNLSIVQIDRLQEQIDLLVASNDRSPDTLRLLTYLHQLIVMARPEKTQLLANYPNPFNPETWIPYELATDTEVRITIYNTHGVVVRTLELGHQSAGYYTGRERAAYWDGRNALGEQVASGIYFYQFETDDMSSLRKMVILK